MTNHIRVLLLALFCALPSFPIRAQVPDLYDETVLRTIDLTFAQSNWYQLLEQSHSTGIDVSADLTADGVTYPNVGVRFRGYSSYNSIGSSQKKPINISMDAFDSSQRLYGIKTINLNNGFRDPTFIREVLCYHIYRKYMPACRANWVIVRINGENWGVYVNVEQINKDMIRRWFIDEDGARYEADATLPSGTTNGAALTWLGTNSSSYANNYDHKNVEINAPWSPLIAACDKLNSGSLSTLKADVEPVLNVDSALWMLAAQVVFVNPDSYLYFGHNYWLYHDVFHDRMQTLPWGMNMTLAATSLAGSSTNARIAFSLFFNQGHSGRPLMNRLLAVPELRKRYLAHVRTLRDEWFDWSILQPKIAAYQALIGTAVAADTKKLYPTSAFTSNVTTSYSAGFFSTITGLEPLITGRRPFIDNHTEVNVPYKTVLNLHHQPLSPAAGQTVWVQATMGGAAVPVGQATLYSRVRGAFDETPMYDDGLHMDGASNDDIYGAALLDYNAGALVEYYVGVETTTDAGGAMSFGPRNAEFKPLVVQLAAPPAIASLQVNEFLAKNGNGLLDEAGETEDWIEIHNPTTASINASGMYLTDNMNYPTKWQIPVGYTMVPGERIVIFADNEPGDGPLHATFKLSASGEEVALFDGDGVTLLDSVAFGQQDEDISTGLLLDSGSLRVSLLSPTAGLPNHPTACGVVAFSSLDLSANSYALSLSADPIVGTAPTLNVTNGIPGAFHHILLAGTPSHQPIASFPSVLLLDPSGLAILPGSLANAAGHASSPLAIPAIPALAGIRVFMQSAVVNASASLEASNALSLTICP